MALKIWHHTIARVDTATLFEGRCRSHDCSSELKIAGSRMFTLFSWPVLDHLDFRRVSESSAFGSCVAH